MVSSFAALLIFCLVVLSIFEREIVEVSNYNCVFVYFSVQFCQCLLHTCCSSCAMYISI